MDKRGLILPIVAIMSIFLLGFAYYVLVIERGGGRDYVVGYKSVKDLASKEIKFKDINGYYEQALKNAIMKSVVEITDSGGGKRDLIWDNNPGVDVQDKFKVVLEKNFNFYVKDIDKKLYNAFEENNIVYPNNFVFKIDKNKVILTTVDKVIVSDPSYVKEKGIYPNINYSRALNIVTDLGFSLGVFDRMYNEFSKSDKCVTTSSNFRDIKCVDECIVEKNTLKYEIPLERVGFVTPVMKFKIPKQC